MAKKLEKIVNLDLWISSNATQEEWDRYEGVLVIFSRFCFLENIGQWAGRETAVGPTYPDANERYRTNYWFVLESGSKKAKEELEKMVGHFNLSKCCIVEMSPATEVKKDFKDKFLKQKELVWSFYR